MTFVIIVVVVLLIYIIASCFLSIREQIMDTANMMRDLRSDLVEVKDLLSAINGCGVQLHNDLIRIEREMPPNGDNGVKE